METMGTIYQLTELTGRSRDANRSVIVLRQEVRRAPFFAALFGVLASLPFMAIVAPFIGVYALLGALVFAIATSVIFTEKQRRHMQVTHFQAFRHRLRATKGIGGKDRDRRAVLLIGGQEFRTPELVMSTHPLMWDGKTGPAIDPFQLNRRTSP